MTSTLTLTGPQAGSPHQAAEQVTPDDMLATCESLCLAGSFQISGAEGWVTPSQGLCRLLDLPADAAPQPLAQVSWIPAAERRLVAHLWRHASIGQPFEIQHGLMTADGRLLQVLHRGLRRAEPGSQGTPDGFAILRDVTDLKAAEQRIQALTHANDTTGLPNRAWLLGKLDSAISTAAWDNRAFSVLSIDVPRIAELASSMGFGSADALALALGERLSRLRASNEMVAQLGSTEFGVVIRHERERVARLTHGRAMEIRDALQAPILLSQLQVFASCRIGVSVFPGDGATAGKMLETAQTARADAPDETAISFHTAQSTARALREMQIEAGLRQALSNAEFSLVYQPQACLKTGAIIGMEALLRWHSPGHGNVPPDEFLPVAERTGLVSALGLWVIEEACRQVVLWREQGVPPVRVAINLSPLQFQVGDVEHDLLQAMQRTGARPEDLCLEITESALLHDSPRVGATLRKLQGLGLEIGLDDFGTGYSSLGRLRSLPIDALKIDRSFVTDMATEPDSASVIRSIIHLAHSLKIRVLAEGVETEAQLALLSAAGCDEIQGFCFSPAVSADAAAEMLKARHQLPARFTQSHVRERTLLLVDDEENILSALRRLFRRDGYRILTATSGMQALEVLAEHPVDVIISDQRMPGMAGVDFLRKAKEGWPDTIRMTLSGFTDLQSIIDAVNEGAVFKFLTKPWDDTRLREHVVRAFQQKELADENRRLAHEVATAGAEQARLNRRLASLLQQQQTQAELAEVSAGGVRELLDLLPVAVLGLDPEGLLAFVNERAGQWLPAEIPRLGDQPSAELTRLLDVLRASPGGQHLTTLAGWPCQAWLRPIPDVGRGRGDMLVLLPGCEERSE